MFKITPNPTFPGEVKISTPEGVATLKLEFKHRGKKALLDLTKEAKTNEQVVFEVVCGWYDVYDANGENAPFSNAALDHLLDHYPSSAKEIAEAYAKLLYEGAEKN